MFERVRRIVRRHPRAVVHSLLAVALVLATWPAWRVALLGAQPTFEELLQFLCAPPSQAR